MVGDDELITSRMDDLLKFKICALLLWVCRGMWRNRCGAGQVWGN